MSHVIQDVADHICTARRAVVAPRQSGVLLRSAERMLHKMRGWIELSRQREALGRLDDRLLEDIGVSRTAATKEVAKHFWMSHFWM